MPALTGPVAALGSAPCRTGPHAPGVPGSRRQGRVCRNTPGRAPGPCWRQQPSLALDTAGPGSPSCKQTTRPHPAPPAASSPAVAGVPPSTITAPGHWAPMLPTPRALHRPGCVKPHPTDSSSVFWPPAGEVLGPLALSAEQRTRVPGLQSHELGPVPTELSRSPEGGTDLRSKSRVGGVWEGGTGRAGLSPTRHLGSKELGRGRKGGRSRGSPGNPPGAPALSSYPRRCPIRTQIRWPQGPAPPPQSSFSSTEGT